MGCRILSHRGGAPSRHLWGSLLWAGSYHALALMERLGLPSQGFLPQAFAGPDGAARFGLAGASASGYLIHLK